MIDRLWEGTRTGWMLTAGPLTVVVYRYVRVYRGGTLRFTLKWPRRVG